MTIFDNLIQFGENGEINYNQWIEWYHYLIPNKPKWLRDSVRDYMESLGHCKKCTALDGC